MEYKHIDKRIRAGKTIKLHNGSKIYLADPSKHHYSKGYPKSFSQLYSESLSAHSIIDSNIGRKIGS